MSVPPVIPKAARQVERPDDNTRILVFDWTTFGAHHHELPSTPIFVELLLRYRGTGSESGYGTGDVVRVRRSRGPIVWANSTLAGFRGVPSIPRRDDEDRNEPVRSPADWEVLLMARIA